MRSRLPLLALFPATVLTVVIATPFVLGDHPVRWTSGSAVPKIVKGDVAEETGQDTGKDTPGTTPTHATGTTPAADPTKVAKVWKEGMPQWGVQYYWEEEPKQRSDAFVEA